MRFINFCYCILFDKGLLYVELGADYMENMIQKILEIDTKAREMTAKSEAVRTEAKSSLNHKKEEMRRQFTEKMQARIAEFEKSERKAAEEQIEKNSEQSKAVMEQLNRTYEDKAEEWVDMLFKRSIS